jgi:hypothetical protein
MNWWKFRTFGRGMGKRGHFWMVWCNFGQKCEFNQTNSADTKIYQTPIEKEDV